MVLEPTKDPSETDKWLLFSTERHDEPRWAAKNPTGAFDNPLTSFRFMPKPTRFGEAFATVALLYGAFVGVPALAGAWAFGKILRWW